MLSKKIGYPDDIERMAQLINHSDIKDIDEYLS